MAASREAAHWERRDGSSHDHGEVPEAAVSRSAMVWVMASSLRVMASW